MTEATSRNPKRLLQLYITGSLTVLLACLVCAALVFSGTFIRKETERSKVFEGQLRHFFEFHYQSMTEEMWTRTYESISMRVSQIAKQLGSAQYSLYLTNPNGNCVFQATESTQAPSCTIPPDVGASLTHAAKSAKYEPVWQYEPARHEYVHVAALYVGAVLQGYLYTSISDPYSFYRGNLFSIAAKTFLPTILMLLLVWLLWLAISKRYILRPYLSAWVEIEKKEALGVLATRLAHDIHSPLATLMSVAQSSKELPPDRLKLLRSAASRIQSIADDLLSRYRSSGRGSQFTFVSAVIHSIVSEKTAALRDNEAVEIRVTMDPEALCLGAPISPSELSRVLSNILNNAIEATTSVPNPRIDVALCISSERLLLEVSDNGIGMSREVLYRVRTAGGTYGKANGAGIGLQHAKAALMSAGGRLEINSTERAGTQVRLELPTTPPPRYFAQSIERSARDKFVVLDDDECMHLLWKEKLAGSDVTFLTKPLEFDTKSYPQELYRYIFDFELAGHTVTGLDLIKSYQLGARAVLATSYFFEESIQRAIELEGAKLLPKFMISQVPIREPEAAQATATPESPDLVLIDDDPMVHELWSFHANDQGVKLLTVANESDFAAHSTGFNTPVYIDKNLGQNVSGLDVASHLHALGFQNLYITTGENPGSFPSEPFIKGIIGKSFPLSPLVDVELEVL